MATAPLTPAAMTNASSLPKVLLGVMTAPPNTRMRDQWREWASLYGSHGHGVDVRFVIGKSFHSNAQAEAKVAASLSRRRRRRNAAGRAEAASNVDDYSKSPAEHVRAESTEHEDFIVVDGREKLPHVGKVTEKSAAWWLNIGRERPGYAFYCKGDDDTLVHLDRLQHVLGAASRERPGEAIYFGHIKWRGWDVGHRFQACGGGWGPAGKTGTDIASGGTLPGGITYPPCPHAAGPYPYMSGGMVCMSNEMVKILSNDAAFQDFFAVAKKRNTEGVPCRSPQACASQPMDVHMWHHEDAGVGFNVFRAVVAANRTMSIVPVPGHYNDAGIIERTLSAQDQYWSTRSVFVHGIKGPMQYKSARTKWHIHRPDAYLGLRCFSCKSGGTNGHNGDWQWARLPCPDASEPRLSGVNASGTSRHCPVEPSDHFTCCGWPWVVPELVELILNCLGSAAAKASNGLSIWDLHREMRRQLRARGPTKNQVGCVRDCVDLQIPGAQSMSGVLRELQKRGQLVLETMNVPVPKKQREKGGPLIRQELRVRLP